MALTRLIKIENDEVLLCVQVSSRIGESESDRGNQTLIP